VVVWGVILGVPMYVDRVVPERLRSTGQGLMAMIGMSIGAMLSNLSAGWLIDRLGATAPAQVGGIGALLLVCLMPWLLPPPRRSEPEES
jgi:MFS family permease